MISKYIHHYLTYLIYQVRRRLPLYANDNSKIFSAYANSLLMQISDPELVFAVRIKRLSPIFQEFY